MAETQEIHLSFTREEFDLVRGFLKARKIYEPYGEKWGYQMWRPFMKDFLAKMDNMAAYLE